MTEVNGERHYSPVASNRDIVVGCGRRMRGDRGYINPRRMDVRTITEMQIARSNGGIRVIEPDRIAGGRALKYLAIERLTTEEITGAPLVVSLRSKVSDKAYGEVLYARAGDRFGVGMRMKTGRVAPKSFSVEGDKSFPPFKSAMGSALMVRRNLASQFETLGHSSSGLIRATLKDWGLSEGYSTLMEGSEVFRDNPLRAILVSSVRFYASRTVIETVKGLGVTKIRTARDSIARGDERSLNHSALEVLALSATGLMMRRNPGFASAWQNTHPGATIGWAYLSDGVSTTVMPDNMGEVFDRLYGGVTLLGNNDNMARGDTIRTWQLAVSAAKNTALEWAERDRLEEQEAREEAGLFSRSIQIPSVLASKSVATKYDPVFLGSVLSDSRVRDAMKRKEMRVGDIQREQPVAISSPVASAMRIYLFQACVKRRVEVSAALRSARTGYDKVTFQVLEDWKPLLRLVEGRTGSNMDSFVKTILRVNGCEDVDGTISEFIQEKKTLWSHFEASVLGKPDSKASGRFRKWLYKSARNSINASSKLEGSPLAGIKDMTLPEVSLEYLKTRLASWVAHLKRPSRIDLSLYKKEFGGGWLPTDSNVRFFSDDPDAPDYLQIPDTLAYELMEVLEPEELNVPLPVITKKNVQFCFDRYLALRQMTAVGLSCVQVIHNSTTGRLLLSLPSDEFARRMAKCMVNRKANIAKRFSESGPTTNHIDNYTPATCAIDLDTLKNVRTLQELVHFCRALPYGYCLVDVLEAVAGVEKRISAIFGDLAMEYERLASTIAEMEDNAEMDDVLRLQTPVKSLEREAAYARTRPIAQPDAPDVPPATDKAPTESLLDMIARLSAGRSGPMMMSPAPGRIFGTWEELFPMIESRTQGNAEHRTMVLNDIRTRLGIVTEGEITVDHVKALGYTDAIGARELANSISDTIARNAHIAATFSRARPALPPHPNAVR